MQRLHTGALGRGLVQHNHLRAIPKVSTILRDLTRHTRLEWEEVADKAVEICHRSGWIHSYMDEEGRNYYTFSSPLHSVVISLFLMPSNDMSQCPTAFELCLAALSNFKHSVTAGNVRISPEFASAKWADVVGRIDFFIPVAKWGIEMETGFQNIIPVLKTLEPMERGFVQVI